MGKGKRVAIIHRGADAIGVVTGICRAPHSNAVTGVHIQIGRERVWRAVERGKVVKQ